MKERRATPRLGLEVPDVLLPDIRDHPIVVSTEIGLVDVKRLA